MLQHEDAEVKEHLRKLTDDYRLTYKDIKDHVKLTEAPLKGVPGMRIQSIIKYKRQNNSRIR